MTIINNRYQVQRELGAGGMGTVYHAYDRLSQTEVAIKRLNIPSFFLTYMSEESGSMLLSLAHEFETLATLRHPNIISVLDYGFDKDKNPYLVEEYLPNAVPITLSALGKSEQEVVRLMIQLLQALAYLHRRGILHRDIKPENVLVIEQNTVKVLDFGLAGARGQDTETSGTLGYLAPEVIRQHHFSEASDLYAVGVLAYESFSGELPFRARSFDQMVKLITEDEVEAEDFPASAATRQIVIQLMHKDPAKRFGSASDAMQALAAAIGETLEESVAIRESFLQAATFVGRETELTLLQAALEETLYGRGSLWLVAGESGVGKSRLLDELRIRALVKGLLVLRGQAIAEGGAAYQLWREALRHLLLSVEVSDLEAGVLKEIVPDIETLLARSVPDAPELEDKLAQQRLQVTIIDVLQRYPAPVVLLLEDLHWTYESLEPVKLLVNRLAYLPVLVIGTYRSDEVPDLPDRLPQATVIHLERLAEQHISALGVAMLGEVGRQPDLVSLLKNETEGNTFFLVEVVRALAEEAGSLADIESMTLPKSVLAGGMAELVRRRLKRVPARYQPLLRLAAIAGRQLDLAVLEHLSGDISLADFLTACQDVAVLEVREVRWRFSHDKLREMLVQDIPAAEAARASQQVAEAYEATRSDLSPLASTLLALWQTAGVAERIRHYAMQVAEHALRISDFQTAIGNFELALRHEPGDEQRIRIYKHLGDAQSALSDNGAAIFAFQQSLQLAERVGDDVARAAALAGIGNLARWSGDYSTARDYCQQALALDRAAGNQAGIARDLYLIAEIHNSQGEHLAAREFLFQSHALARQLDQPELLGRVLNFLGGNHAATAEFEKSNAYYTQALSILRNIGNRFGTAACLNNLGNDALAQSDLAGAEGLFKESLEIFRDIGNRNAVAACLINLGSLTLRRDELAQADDYYRESIARAREISHPFIHCFGLLGMTQVHLRRQDLAAARATLIDILEIARRLDSTLINAHAILAWATYYRANGNLPFSAELLGAVMAHPVLDKEVLDAQVSPLRDQLQAALSPEEWEAYLAAGHSKDLPQILTELANRHS